MHPLLKEAIIMKGAIYVRSTPVLAKASHEYVIKILRSDIRTHIYRAFVRIHHFLPQTLFICTLSRPKMRTTTFDFNMTSFWPLSSSRVAVGHVEILWNGGLTMDTILWA